MFSRFLRMTAPMLAVVALPACAQLPPDYSPHYVRVPVQSQKHPGRIDHYELVPEACLVPDPSDTGLGGSRLPPGCANAANLLAMVERKGDVVQGRKLGTGPASPSARAAQRYIYGPRDNNGPDVNTPPYTPSTTTPTGNSAESVPPVH